LTGALRTSRAWASGITTMTVLQTMPKQPSEPSKTRTHGGKRDGAGRKPVQDRARDASTLVRSSQAWKDAVSAFAEWDRAPSVSDLIDRAIVAYARERRYDKAFPRR